MDNLPQPPTPLNLKSDDPHSRAAADAYAQVLLQKTTDEFKSRQAMQPKPHHYIQISRKRLIWLAISIVFSLIFSAIVSHLFKPETNQGKNVIKSTNDLINNPAPTN